MNKLIRQSLIVAWLVLGVSATRAAEPKPVTLSGEGKCAKCALKETKTCQNAITVEEGDKKITYLLEDNDLSKKFHSNLCSDTKKIKVVGVVKEKEGKKYITAEKLELATTK